MKRSEDILVEMFMIEMGIAPIGGKSPSNALKSLESDEARKYKRKFRKLWRKAQKSILRETGIDYGDLCGRSRSSQTISQKRFRRGIVARMIRDELAKKVNL